MKRGEDVLEQEIIDTEEKVYREVEVAVREDKEDLSEVKAFIALLVILLNQKSTVSRKDVTSTCAKIRFSIGKYEERSVLRFERVLESVSASVHENISSLLTEHFSQFEGYSDKWHTNKNSWVDNFRYSVAKMEQKIIKSLIVNASYIRGEEEQPLDTEAIVRDTDKGFASHASTMGAIFHDEGQYIFIGTLLLAMKANGYTHFKFKAVMDERTSDICRDMNGRVFPISAWRVGVTAPPLHPHCRSIVTPFKYTKW